MRLSDTRHETQLLDQLTLFLRQRVRDQVGTADAGGTEGRLAELRTLRELQLGHAEARAHPERRRSVIARFRRLALRHRRHPDFDASWVIDSPDTVVTDALELLVEHERVDLAGAAALLTSYAEEQRTDLVEVAAQLVALHGPAARPVDETALRPA
ncbi:hypothetical protein [Nocardioides aurantiacus]|uniref:Uncharacterized protein n=1 Tax=Nocardioides aurantiacus TaxID=86796 RepID=A0A3N2CSM0_9ACTN|nr:hypothetical protein [Nocardioides aurantiacus]ROR90547.1 hypothetical protein EDD33_1388 [Nocardioides aurantiacus]